MCTANIIIIFTQKNITVAVKTVKSGSSSDEKIDFLSEADMMKRFDHRNIGNPISSGI